MDSVKKRKNYWNCKFYGEVRGGIGVTGREEGVRALQVIGENVFESWFKHDLVMYNLDSVYASLIYAYV